MSAAANGGAARRAALRHRSFLVGGGLSLLFVTAALVSLVWTPESATAIDIAGKLRHPSAGHWLGTDHFGRDIFSMLMVGAQNAVAVALVAVGFGMVLGVPLGALAAARRGWLDETVMRFNDLAFAFPALLTAVMITALAGPGAINSILAIGLFNVPVFARVMRAAALVLWRREFVLAARALGLGPLAITLRHILPNAAGILIVQATIQFALAILAEAGLSYLGLGTQPPAPSWGRMLNEAQSMLFIAPQLAVYPGLAIALTVLGLNLMGDGLRDLLDPRVRRSLQ